MSNTREVIEATYAALTDCQAKRQYDLARNTKAFNVLGAAERHKNQHGTAYKFPDGSWLSCSHSGNWIAYGPELGVAYAIRPLWDDRRSSPRRHISRYMLTSSKTATATEQESLAP